jgi:predicted alpha/beta-hydrolase family hydrolase
VLAHGAGTSIHHSSWVPLVEALAAAGIATFRYNFPYKEQGRSRPDNPEVTGATVRAAVAAAAQAAPGLPLFAGGRSFGGRMTSLAASEAPLPGVRGIIFFAFPLHPAGAPATTRAAHLAKVTVPMLFLQGPRDELATPGLLEPIVAKLPLATLHWVAAADHSFKVLKRSGRTDAEVLAELVAATRDFVDQNSA